MDEILVAFIEDGRDHLDAIESGLLSMEGVAPDADTLNAVFRAAHTIKGDAGVVELPHIEHFAHRLEDSFDQLRKGHIEASPVLVSLLLRGCDHIKSMFADVLAGRMEPDAALKQACADLELELHELVEGVAADVDPTNGLAAPETAPRPRSRAECWRVSVQFAADILEKGMDPRDFFNYLESKGEVVEVLSRAELGFDVFLFSVEPREAIEQVFDFARDNCSLNILPPGGDAENGITEPAHELSGDSAVKTSGLEAASKGERRPDDSRAIRVQAEKLDQLVDLVGEMVVSSASANLLARSTGHSQLMEANSGLARLIERMRELSLQLRMVQIGDTFNRFRRVVRDMARELNREIELSIHGAETELDKSVVEKIGDPLMHLVRNAVDHGIEPASVRVSQGKSAAGTLELNAFHEAGGIVIEVADDGAGLDKNRILAKALERGLVQENQVLSDSEIYNLIFLPGFSTAEKVTNISGRGVGMDVVRSNINALRGSVEVNTEPGKGSRFVIKLPLTMAIIDGFLVSAGKGSYVIPLDRVMECTEFNQADINRNYINLRGEVLPFVRLRDLFGLDGAHPVRENMVIVQSDNKRAGIIVDTLLGEFQTVIKPLSTVFQNVKGIAGSTILGTGEVGLILDIPALIKVLSDEAHRHDDC